MDGTILFKKDTTAIKNSKHMKRGVFVIISPRHIKVESASYCRIDTETVVFSPTNSRGFITLKVNGNELKEFFEGEHRLWIEILNRSFEDNIIIKKDKLLGFLVIEPENLRFQHVPPNKSIKQKRRRTARYRRKRQLDRFLSRYDFSYVGRGTVNQATKNAPGIIKTATKDINNIAKQRLNQLIFQRGKEVERVLPKVLRGSIEDIHQTPFRLLGNVGKNQFNKLKLKILKW